VAITHLPWVLFGTLGTFGFETPAPHSVHWRICALHQRVDKINSKFFSRYFWQTTFYPTQFFSPFNFYIFFGDVFSSLVIGFISVIYLGLVRP
jgi:hypothetical protein